MPGNYFILNAKAMLPSAIKNSACSGIFDCKEEILTVIFILNSLRIEKSLQNSLSLYQRLILLVSA